MVICWDGRARRVILVVFALGHNSPAQQGFVFDPPVGIQRRKKAKVNIRPGDASWRLLSLDSG